MTLEIGITYMQRNTTLELRIIYMQKKKNITMTKSKIPSYL